MSVLDMPGQSPVGGLARALSGEPSFPIRKCIVRNRAYVPVMAENPSVDTTLPEPAADAGETDMLLFALERSRAQFSWKTAGLDTAGLDRPHPPSHLTLRKLLRHLAVVEHHYTTVHVTGEAMLYPEWPELPKPAPPWKAVVFAEPDWAWQVPADESAEQVYALWHAAVRRSRAAWATAIADGGLGQPSKYVDDSGATTNLRRRLVDLHDEYARHVGHADLIREAVDRLVGEDPPKARYTLVGEDPQQAR